MEERREESREEERRAEERREEERRAEMMREERETEKGNEEKREKSKQEKSREEERSTPFLPAPAYKVASIHSCSFSRRAQHLKECEHSKGSVHRYNNYSSNNNIQQTTLYKDVETVSILPIHNFPTVRGSGQGDGGERGRGRR